MKKILAIIPALMVAGALLFNGADTSKENQKQAAVAKEQIVLYAEEPGTGW
ncbi:hypothetical protein ACUTUE_27235 [Bacillus sp. NA_146.1]|uniref:hypothetical protein n=1 Tax=Bacillus wiedmannii TaxID=1890302 RepID=UPI0015CF81B6|nr:hypothetical protein [Bacillus wiedmannii]